MEGSACELLESDALLRLPGGVEAAKSRACRGVKKYSNQSPAPVPARVHEPKAALLRRVPATTGQTGTVGTPRCETPRAKRGGTRKQWSEAQLVGLNVATEFGPRPRRELQLLCHHGRSRSSATRYQAARCGCRCAHGVAGFSRGIATLSLPYQSSNHRVVCAASGANAAKFQCFSTLQSMNRRVASFYAVKLGLPFDDPIASSPIALGDAK